VLPAKPAGGVTNISTSPGQLATDPDPKPAGSAEANWGQMTDRDRFIAAMEKSGWVQAKAARILGLTPRQIGYALKKHGIEVKHL
jgi:Nif-specific regulatory protein